MPNHVPDEVILSPDRKQLRLSWAEGRELALSVSALRTACRCAWCTRDRILNQFSAVSDHVSLDGVEALGSHGLHLRFSDGHERGIFPWAYLKDLATAQAPEPTISH